MFSPTQTIVAIIRDILVKILKIDRFHIEDKDRLDEQNMKIANLIDILVMIIIFVYLYINNKISL